MSKYIDNAIVEWKHAPLYHHIHNLSFTPTGYGEKIPTQYMVRIRGKWHRIFTRIYSNVGSSYVVLNGDRYWLSSCFVQDGLTERGKVEKEIVGYYADAVAWQIAPGYTDWKKSSYRKLELEVYDMLDRIEPELLHRLLLTETTMDVGQALACFRDKKVLHDWSTQPAKKEVQELFLSDPPFVRVFKKSNGKLVLL